MKPPYKALTLAIHPSSRGFGWVAFEGPFSPYDWGIVSARGPNKNATCLRRIDKLLRMLSPETLVLEAFEPEGSARQSRIVNLYRSIVALAGAQSIDVEIYRFTQVQRNFERVGARTRRDIAEAITRQTSVFSHLLPNKRRTWDHEDPRMPLFSAASLAATHFQSIATAFLNGKRL